MKQKEIRGEETGGKRPEMRGGEQRKEENERGEKMRRKRLDE